MEHGAQTRLRSRYLSYPFSDLVRHIFMLSAIQARVGFSSLARLPYNTPVDHLQHQRFPRHWVGTGSCSALVRQALISSAGVWSAVMLGPAGRWGIALSAIFSWAKSQFPVWPTTMCGCYTSSTAAQRTTYTVQHRPGQPRERRQLQGRSTSGSAAAPATHLGVANTI